MDIPKPDTELWTIIKHPEYPKCSVLDIRQSSEYGLGICTLFNDAKTNWKYAKLITAVPQGLHAAKCIYLWLLINVGIGTELRIKVQGGLGLLRDYIAAAEGKTAEKVQDEFENEAALQSTDKNKTERGNNESRS